MQQIPRDTESTSTLVVTEAHTARALGSGDLPVLGTPALIALMENAAMEAVAPYLDEGESSVGTTLNISHNQASAVGDRIRATATVMAVDGRRINFMLYATDDSGKELLGRGTHTRFVVDVEKFMRKIGK